jgi:hypothetical protein
MFIQTEQAKIKNLIYCYGYSSKLLSKMREINQDYYSVIKDYFLTPDAKKYLRHDFEYRFLELFSRGE